MNNNTISNTEKSFLYFISNLSYHLDLTLKNTRINVKLLEKILDIYITSFFTEGNINVVVNKHDNTDVSLCLNIIQAYHILFRNNSQMFITSVAGKTTFDNLIKTVQLISIPFSIKPDLDLNKQKTILSTKSTIGGQSKLVKETPGFEITKIRNEKFDLIVFDTWRLQNVKKINDVLIELDSQNTKVIASIKDDDVDANDLFKSLESSIIVNKIKIK